MQQEIIMQKAFYERLVKEYANNSDVPLSPADAFAALVTGRSVCAAVFFREKELLVSNNAPQEGHDIQAELSLHIERNDNGVDVVLKMIASYLGHSLEAIRCAEVLLFQGAYMFEGAAIGDGGAVTACLCGEPFSFDFPGLGAPADIRIKLVSSIIVELVKVAWLTKVPLTIPIPIKPTNVEPFKNMPQQLCTLLRLCLYKENPKDMLNSFVGIALFWELRCNRDMRLTAAGDLFTLLTTEGARSLSDQCHKFATVVNELSDEGLQGDMPDTVAGDWSQTTFAKVAGGVFKRNAGNAWEAATRLVRFFRFLLSSLKSDENHPITKFLVGNTPDDMVTWPISVIDGDLPTDVHAEMRFLHAHSEILLPENRAAFGIGRLCCGHCFVYLRSNGMQNIGSHGTCYPWSFPEAPSHLGNLQLLSTDPQEIEQMHEFTAFSNADHKDLKAKLGVEGDDIETRGQYGKIE